jgi:hypothetical protein
MTRKNLILACLLVLGVLGLVVGVGSVAAQESPDNKTSTPQNETTTESEETTQEDEETSTEEENQDSQDEPPTSDSSNEEEETEEDDETVSVGSLLEVGNNEDGQDAQTVLIDLGAFGHIYDIEYNQRGEYAWVYVKADRHTRLTFSDGNDRNTGGNSRVFVSTASVPEGKYRYKVQTDHVNGRQCVMVNGQGTPADYAIRNCNGDVSNNFFSGQVPKMWIPYGLGAFLIGAIVYVSRWLRNREKSGKPESVIDGSPAPESGVVGASDELSSGDDDE